MTASTSSPWPEENGAVTELLLGQLVANGCGEDSGDEGVHARALFLGGLLDSGVQFAGEADQAFLGLGHIAHDITSCDMLGDISKWTGAIAVARSATPGGWS
jgi:hypothetical protein